MRKYGVSVQGKNGLRELFSDHALTREELRVLENRKKKLIIFYMYSEISIYGHVSTTDTFMFSGENTCVQLEL